MDRKEKTRRVTCTKPIRGFRKHLHLTGTSYHHGVAVTRYHYDIPVSRLNEALRLGGEEDDHDELSTHGCR